MTLKPAPVREASAIKTGIKNGRNWNVNASCRGTASRNAVDRTLGSWRYGNSETSKNNNNEQLNMPQKKRPMVCERQKLRLTYKEMKRALVMPKGKPLPCWWILSFTKLVETRLLCCFSLTALRFFHLLTCCYSQTVLFRTICYLQ